jgi:hypothetical protein
MFELTRCRSASPRGQIPARRTTKSFRTPTTSDHLSAKGLLWPKISGLPASKLDSTGPYFPRLQFLEHIDNAILQSLGEFLCRQAGPLRPNVSTTTIPAFLETNGSQETVPSLSSSAALIRSVLLSPLLIAMVLTCPSVPQSSDPPPTTSPSRHTTMPNIEGQQDRKKPHICCVERNRK